MQLIFKKRNLLLLLVINFSPTPTLTFISHFAQPFHYYLLFALADLFNFKNQQCVCMCVFVLPISAISCGPLSTATRIVAIFLLCHCSCFCNCWYFVSLSYFAVLFNRTFYLLVCSLLFWVDLFSSAHSPCLRPCTPEDFVQPSASSFALSLISFCTF